MTVAFDHLMVMVGHEDRAAKDFASAGYAVTPRSELPGMANRLVCFPSALPYAACFLELLAIERRDDVPPQILSFLGEALGPRAIVVAVADMDGYCGWLGKAGISFAGPIPIRREWKLPGGEVLNVHLDILLPEARPDLVRWVAVKHHTVHHYLRSDFVQHANAHPHFAGVVVAANEPRYVASELARIWQSEVVFNSSGAVVQLPGVRVVVKDARELSTEGRREPFIVGTLMHRASDRPSSCAAEDDCVRLLRYETVKYPGVYGFTMFCATSDETR